MLIGGNIFEKVSKKGGLSNDVRVDVSTANLITGDGFRTDEEIAVDAALAEFNNQLAVDAALANFTPDTSILTENNQLNLNSPQVMYDDGGVMWVRNPDGTTEMYNDYLARLEREDMNNPNVLLTQNSPNTDEITTDNQDASLLGSPYVTETGAVVTIIDNNELVSNNQDAGLLGSPYVDDTGAVVPIINDWEENGLSIDQITINNPAITENGDIVSIEEEWYGRDLGSNYTTLENGARLPIPEGTEYNITSEFGNRINPVTGLEQHHDGIDIAVPENTPVHATQNGVILRAEESLTLGNVVVIEHDNNIITQYAHNNELHVQQGDNVQAGQHIADSGDTGRSSGPHIHYEITDGIEYNQFYTNPRTGRVDPLDFVWE